MDANLIQRVYGYQDRDAPGGSACHSATKATRPKTRSRRVSYIFIFTFGSSPCIVPAHTVGDRSQSRILVPNASVCAKLDMRTSCGSDLGSSLGVGFGVKSCILTFRIFVGLSDVLSVTARSCYFSLEIIRNCPPSPPEGLTVMRNRSLNSFEKR